jgi:hypothetical protein
MSQQSIHVLVTLYCTYFKPAYTVKRSESLLAMPLPPDCILPLFAQPSPSEMVSAKSRQAMIVRMSAETLDALELAAQSMDVEFSDNPVRLLHSSYSSPLSCFVAGNLHRKLFLSYALFEGGQSTRAIPPCPICCKANGSS